MKIENGVSAGTCACELHKPLDIHISELLKLAPRRSTLRLPSSAMTSLVSPLRPSAQLTIDAINLPFRLLEHICTPTIAYLRSSYRLLCRIAQNRIFLCLLYLHLWRTFKSLPPIRALSRYWTRIVTGSMFNCCATCSALILCMSVPFLAASWHDRRNESHAIRVHCLALFVLTCAPACAVLGAAAAVLYYAFKRHQHGMYLANMRKQRNGRWADPREFGDWRKASSREEGFERLKAWDLVENKVSFRVDRVCVGCGAVKGGLSSRCEGCGDHGERMVRRTNT